MRGRRLQIWDTQRLRQPLSEDGKLAIDKKESNDDEKNPVKYLATNKIDALTKHVIRSSSKWWRIETFFEDSKRDFDLGDYEMQTDEGASRSDLH